MTSITPDRVLPWLLRVIWVAVVVVGGPAISDAAADQASVVGDVATWSAFSVWVVGVAAMAIPSTVGLTATRLIVPLTVPVAVLTLLAGGDGWEGWALLVGGVLAAVVAMSAGVGRIFVQASAYGAEERHLLRPPPAYLAAAVLTWSIWAAAAVAAPLLLADRRWIIGAVALLVAVGGAVLGWPRWHRLARRWLVFVPIGVVVHDHLVLAETLLLRRGELTGLRLAPADTGAADLTGPAAGHALEITAADATTVIFAASPREPRGRVVHLRAALVAPSRPGRALASAASRRLPVG